VLVPETPDKDSCAAAECGGSEVRWPPEPQRALCGVRALCPGGRTGVAAPCLTVPRAEHDAVATCRVSWNRRPRL